MNYLSVCSGIEAATVAWHDMGWNPVGFSEIEKFPSQLLAHHYPNVTNYGDMTKFKEWNINEPVNLLVGGTPCQSFSVAGLRKGLEDPRGNLMLTYLAMADHFKPKWLLWENVPGVLSSNRGSDFAALLQGLAELGYGFAYRVLDAQHFGVPQRRRRVFVVGCLGDWRSAAKVLFESESLCRDITPRRSEGQKATGTLTRGFGDRGYDLDQIAGGGYKIDWPAKTASTGAPLFVPDAYNITFCDANGTRKDRPDGGLYVNKTDTSNTLTRAGVGTNALQNMRVRRLTPMECERLQGFPDNYTNTPTSSDSTRYKALGNSMAVPVMKWIGKKITEINYEKRK
jgi:DNA (cytosine-5)-methyltransferase 1